MKKIFTFSIMFLLSLMTTVSYVQAQSLPEFTQENANDASSHWYYVRFVRAWNMAKVVWSKSDTTLLVRQEAMRPEDQRQHWKFVGNEASCYIVNRATGQKLFYSGETALYEGVPEGIRTDRYFLPATNISLSASNFKFDEYTGTAADYRNTVQLLDIAAAKYLNDQQRQTLCVYSKNDAGAPISWVSINDKDLATHTDSIFVEAPKGFTSKDTVRISSFNLSSVDVTISGSDAAAFTLSATALTPNASGVARLDIVFAPTEVKEYTAFVTFSAQGLTKTVKLTGLGFNESDLPKISNGSEEYWYYIRFSRRPGRVWSMTGDTIRQLSPSDDDHQLWKFEGNWDEGYYLINKAEAKEMKYSSLTPGRYVETYTGIGDVFQFVHFKATEGLTGDWQLMNLTYSSSTSRYVNDSQGSQITNYSRNDAGCSLTFIPYGTTDILINTASVEFPVYEKGDTTITRAYMVSGLNLSGNISATITGTDAAAFSLSQSSLPAAGDSLRITFNQTALRHYDAELNLNSGDITVKIPIVAGAGLPVFSSGSKEYWYYIYFNRNTTGQVWTALGVDNPIKQQPRLENDYNQQWKLDGDWSTGYRIINRAGGQLGFAEFGSLGQETIWLALKAGDSDETMGDLFLFERQSSTGKWHLHTESVEYGYPNDFGNSNRGNETNQYRIGPYDDGAGDNGNTVMFIAAGTGTAITIPAMVEPDGKVIAVKYYTLMGQEVIRPTATGVYIVRSLYDSGKVKAVKKLFIVK